MDLETIVKKLDDLENKVMNYDKVFKTVAEQIADLDKKLSGLPANYRDLKDEVNQVKKTLAGLGSYDKAMTQLRKDMNGKFEEQNKNTTIQQEQFSKLYQSDLKSISAKMDRLDEKLKSELDKKLQRYIDEDSHTLATVDKIEMSVNKKLKGDEDIRRNLEVQRRDLESVMRRVEIISDDFSQFPKQQMELITKISLLSEDVNQIQAQLQELKAAETQRKMAQTAFIEQQEISNKNRESRFDEIQRKAAEEIQRITSLMEKLNQKEKELTLINDNLEETTRLYERRLKEVSELYQLFEAKYQKEWNSFKSDSEKNWVNYSLINEEKQTAFNNRMEELKNRVTAFEDQMNDVQELLGLMSSEIQKGMLSLMKMANNWKDAFDNIQSS
jgi:DNA repair exonuclease SbcCD ATPase subunit